MKLSYFVIVNGSGLPQKPSAAKNQIFQVCAPSAVQFLIFRRNIQCVSACSGCKSMPIANFHNIWISLSFYKAILYLLSRKFASIFFFVLGHIIDEQEIRRHIHLFNVVLVLGKAFQVDSQHLDESLHSLVKPPERKLAIYGSEVFLGHWCLPIFEHDIAFRFKSSGANYVIIANLQCESTNLLWTETSKIKKNTRIAECIEQEY